MSLGALGWPAPWVWEDIPLGAPSLAAFLGLVGEREGGGTADKGHAREMRARRRRRPPRRVPEGDNDRDRSKPAKIVEERPARLKPIRRGCDGGRPRQCALTSLRPCAVEPPAMPVGAERRALSPHTRRVGQPN